MPPESESQTRRSRIDTKLDARGWPQPPNGVIPIKTSYRLPEIETTTGPADYGLFNDEGLMAIVEAKKLTLARRMSSPRLNGTPRALGGRTDQESTVCPLYTAQTARSLVPRSPRSAQPLSAGRRLPLASCDGGDADFAPDSGARLAVEATRALTVYCATTSTTPTPPSSRPSLNASVRC